MAMLGCSPPQTPQTPTTVTVTAAPGPVTPEATGYHCDGNPFHIGNHDYCAYDTPASWRDAQRACDAISARLMTFTSEAQARAIAEAFGPALEISAEAFWMGLRESEDIEGSWQWSDGSPVKYTHWNKGEPNDDGENEDCAEWKLGTGSWNDAPCWSYRKYICQQIDSKPLTCDGTRLRTDQGELCFSSEALDWDTAKQVCRDYGGRLLVVSTPERDAWLHKTVGPKLGLHSVWLGYNDMVQEGRWHWLSNSRYEFDRWKEGEPNDFRGGEDCAEWYPEDGLMNDLACSAQRPYVCERIDK